MCPRSGFRSGGTCERTFGPGFRFRGTSKCTFVPVFVPGEHLPKPPFWKPPFFGRGLLGTDPRDPRDPTLESASPSPPQRSIWHRNRVKSGRNRCRINVESMPNRPLRRGGRSGFEGAHWGPGSLCLISPFQTLLSTPEQ